jgi:tetratricopeptide (TPR) repeat protein
MAKTEWFRRTTWSAEDAADFAARLKRSRGMFHRAQYLRIQALHLERTEEGSLLLVALGLLQQLITEYPDPSQLAEAFHQHATCMVALGDIEGALTAYHKSFEAQRRYPKGHTNAYRDFGELVTSLGRSDLYDEVIALEKEFGGKDLFPAHQFQTAKTHALILAERGQLEDARHFAQIALAATAATESPFRYHRKLGLVDRAAAQVLQRLRELAA